MSMLIFTACSGQRAEDSFNQYKKAWEDQDYQAMYSMISKDSKEYISKEDFVDRYTNIYNGIGVKNIDINIKDDGDDKENIQFTLKMDTLAGQISLDTYQAKMIKEKNGDKKDWFIEWDESLIFPQMEKEDAVRLAIIRAKRGEIYDGSGKGLARNGSRYSIGIHPGQYDESSNKEVANLLDIDEEIISDKLSKNTNPQHLVPLVKISLEDKEILNKLLEIKGIISQEVEGRVYPGGEAFGSLIGYIKPITAEQLEKDQEDIYHNTSLVGNLGLETVYEKELRAQDGKEIYISKIENGQEVEKIVLAKKKPVDGKDINISIDSELQKQVYNEMGGEIGAATAIDPITGQVLAMVSSPSFDSNLYTSYIPNTQREKWEAMDVNVFQNRFNKAYSPGSTFKIVTSAIGLEDGHINPEAKMSIQGKSWQNDTSWGNYKINRVSQKLSSVDLKDAFIYSDNIYFARTALKIGDKDLLKGAKRFGFSEDIPIKYPFADSQIVNADKELENEILLADTGYGQGQVLMSPLHLSLVYSMLVNGGDIMEPMLEKAEPKLWKKDVVSDRNRTILLNSLVHVIEDPNGTGHGAKLNGIKLAGKTGTAELKLTQEGRGKENGWFVAMDVDNPKIVISMMVENVEDRGGSHYIVPRVKNIMEYYLRDK